MNETLDLGVIEQPVLVCGGAYGNLEALEALERWAALHGFGPHNIIHSGDAAAYCADPHLASSFIRERGWPSIKGNVEEQLAAGADDCACGFEEGSVCNTMSARWFAHADRSISRHDRAWMAGLLSRIRFTMNGRRFAVVHGSVELTNCFMFESLDEAVFAEQIGLADADAVIAGHTGIPFTRMIGERVWHNCGALGMPANDATPRVWFSTLTPEGDAIRFAHHALVYDHLTAAEKLRRADLPSGYGDGLETGLWPSLDILPPAEAAQTGQPISRTDVVWQSALAQAI
ncbi:MAG: metallophosphoesterase family protein [Hyphomicrobiales bacterium]|nr:metallophosphoesterase family protein [Hyphomicrobiales bacterium]